MQREMKYGVVLALVMVLSSCSWFGHKNVAEPATLKPIKAQVHLKRLWERRIGHGARDRASKLVPALSGDRIFAASADGTIKAMALGTGKVIWEKHVQNFFPRSEREAAFAPKSDAIMGGVGAGGDIIAVGTFGGVLVAMNQSDGSLAWKARTTSEVVAPPQINGGMVVVQSIDGKVAAYNALDGSREWVYNATIPSLTLRGTSTPILTNSYVIAGFANGHVAVIDRNKGIATIDQRIAVPKGKSDIDRLVDVDGQMAIDNGMLFAASYQGNVVGLDLSSGKLIWSNPASSIAGVAVGFDNVYLVSFNGEVSALSETDGQTLWHTDALLHRNLTTPEVISSYVAVGDLEGYIQLLAQTDGHIVGRTRVIRGPLTAPFVVNGSRLYVETRSGLLFAYALRQGAG